MNGKRIHDDKCSVIDEAIGLRELNCPGGAESRPLPEARLAVALTKGSRGDLKRKPPKARVAATSAGNRLLRDAPFGNKARAILGRCVLSRSIRCAGRGIASRSHEGREHPQEPCDDKHRFAFPGCPLQSAGILGRSWECNLLPA